MIARVDGPELEINSSEVWNGKIRIPSVPPSLRGGICPIIDIKYVFVIEVGKLVFDEFDIIIGTIPFQNDNSRTILENSNVFIASEGDRAIPTRNQTMPSSSRHYNSVGSNASIPGLLDQYPTLGEFVVILNILIYLN